MGFELVPSELLNVESYYRKGNNDRLSHFQAIDSSQDVYGICAENCQHSHVHIVQET